MVLMRSVSNSTGLRQQQQWQGQRSIGRNLALDGEQAGEEEEGDDGIGNAEDKRSSRSWRRAGACRQAQRNRRRGDSVASSTAIDDSRDVLPGDSQILYHPSPVDNTRAGALSSVQNGRGLADWEAAAVAMYRAIRRYRSEAGALPVRRNAHQHKEEALSSHGAHDKDAIVPPIALLLGSAFPQLLEGCPNRDATSYQCERASHVCSTPHSDHFAPLLLQFFLYVGYPLRVAPSTRSAYTAALRYAARQTADWFQNVDSAPLQSAAALPLRRLGVELLPDVVQQMVVAHRMTPSTAATWLLHLYLAILKPEKERESHYAMSLAHRHRFPNTDPLSPLSYPCRTRLRFWAAALCKAAYQLQLHACRRDSAGVGVAPLGNAAHDPSVGFDDSAAPQKIMTYALDSPQSSPDVWESFLLTVLQQTTALLLHSCLCAETTPGDAAVEEDNTSEAATEVDMPAAQIQLTTLLPPAPVSRVIVEGLMALALEVRLHPEFATSFSAPQKGVSSSANTSACPVHNDSATNLAQKHWEAHSRLAIQQLRHIPQTYSHLVLFMDFVLRG